MNFNMTPKLKKKDFGDWLQEYVFSLVKVFIEQFKLLIWTKKVKNYLQEQDFIHLFNKFSNYSCQSLVISLSRALTTNL